MLRSFSSLNEVSVYDNRNQAIGVLEDILINKQGKTIGFRIDQKGLLLHDHLLPYPHLLQVKENELTVTNNKNVSSPNWDHYDYVKELMDKPFLSKDEQLLGIVKDVYFSSDLGNIELIEITEGWFTDLQEGRKYLHWHDVNYDGQQLVTTHFTGGGFSDEMPKLHEQKSWENRL